MHKGCRAGLSSWGEKCGRGHSSFKSRQEEVGSYLCSSGQCWEELCEGGDMSWLAMNLLAGGSKLREDALQTSAVQWVPRRTSFKGAQAHKVSKQSESADAVCS